MPKIVKQNMRPQAKVQGVQDAWDLTDYLSVLLYGESATGKTTTWSSFPGPILAIICSGGKRPGELRSIKTPEMMKKVTARACSTGDQVQEQLEQAAKGNYETVVLDHGTGLSDMLLREELGVEELPQQKSWGMASRQQYGAVALRVKEVLHRILSLECHRVIVAQEKNHNEFAGEGETVAGEDSIIKPVMGASFSGSVIRWLNPACDYILQTFKRPRYKVMEKVVGVGNKRKTIQTRVRLKGIEYCLRCEPNDTYITKFRMPKGHALPDVIVDPNFDKIMAVIDGEK